MKLYREVKASKRLPEDEDRFYFTIEVDGAPSMTMGGALLDNDVWLEPIEITEEEIRDMILMVYYGTLNPGPGELTEWADESARAILSKLKGE